MCTERPKSNESIIKIFSRLKACIVEAEKPLVDIALGTMRYYVTKLKKGRMGNGNREKANTGS